MNELAQELASLKREWESGRRELGIARRIVFLVWYSFFASPLDNETPLSPVYIESIPDEVLSTVEESAKSNLESALVLGYMISFEPFVFGPGDVWFPKAQSILETAYRIAEEQDRRKNELSLIGYHLAVAIEGVKKSQPSTRVEEEDDEGDVDETFFDSENYGYFTEMFFGDSEYDHYFAQILGRR
jgi:hypothetical protein